MSVCKGEKCKAIEGVGHSSECIKNHNAIYDAINGVPKCFDRAEHNGRLFDNCRYIHECKHRKAICVNNPEDSQLKYCFGGRVCEETRKKANRET